MSRTSPSELGIGTATLDGWQGRCAGGAQGGLIDEPHVDRARDGIPLEERGSGD